MRKAGLIFLFLGLITNSIAQQNEVFVVKGKTIDSNLEGFIYSAKNIKFNTSKDLINQKTSFKNTNEPLPNFGLNNDENWIRFELKNDENFNKNLVLFLDQTYLEKADFYQFQHDSMINKIELNQAIIIEKRPFKNPNFVFPFELKSNQQNSIFLRIKADSIYGISRALIRLSDEDSFHKNLRRNNLSLGILIGFLSLSFFVGILLFYSGKKSVYATYGIYILSVLLYYLCNNGFLNALSADTFWGSARFSHLNLWVGSALHLYLIDKFLDLKKQFSKTFQYFVFSLIAISIFLTFTYILLPIPPSLSYFTRILLFIIGFVIIFLAFWGIIQKQQKTLLYSLAVFPSILLIIYFLLTALRVLPLHPLSFSLAFPFTVFEIIVFGVGLVYQFNEERNAIERKLNEERTAVATKIILAQEQERQRISQDLHDDLGSTLSILKIRLEESNKNLDNQLISEIETTNKAVDDLRLISYNLMPTMFRERGLLISLNEFILLNKIESKVVFLHSGNEKRLNLDTELSIYRIIKELLNNAIKHAKASRIELQLIYFEDFLYLSIEDNGIGIKENQTESKGNGLKNLDLRVNYLNGKMNRESSDKGTLISIEIPYEPNPEDKITAD